MFFKALGNGVSLPLSMRKSFSLGRAAMQLGFLPGMPPFCRERVSCLVAVGIAFLFSLGASGATVASPDQLHVVGEGANAKVTNLAYTPAPVDNPLKGFVPYQDQSGRLLFPHSLAFEYLALRDLMTGPASFNWSTLEQWLNSATGEGCQLAFRVYLDYPDRTTGIPQYLLDGGLITRSYTDYDNTNSVAPDYTDPNLQAALTNFTAPWTSATMATRASASSRLVSWGFGVNGTMASEPWRSTLPRPRFRRKSSMPMWAPSIKRNC